MSRVTITVESADGYSAKQIKAWMDAAIGKAFWQRSWIKEYDIEYETEEVAATS